ncbi:MAG: signal peptidase I [Alphaproteobacteria bacterium]|nr:signal peptidase I [Alphaproteobacteria bacterium]
MKTLGRVLIGLVVCASFSLILMRVFWMQPFNIPAGSMIPTVLIGDNILVSKTAYGYSRYSFPFGKNINYFSGRMWGKEPKLGDVAVFRSVAEPGTDFIKRVVGLPGDRIQIKKGILHINSVPCPLEPAGEFETVNNDGTILKAPQFIEMLPNGLKHSIVKQIPFGEGRYDNTAYFDVPPGHYFMLGDNRDASNDSRVQGLIGYIPLENLVGRASFVFFTTGSHASLLEPENWSLKADYNRIGQGIH